MTEGMECTDLGSRFRHAIIKDIIGGAASVCSANAMKG